MKQVNKNFIYNIIYQVFIYLIPLISVPYTSRVLGVNNIGIYSYTYSIVYYFMLAAMLGINNYGSRMIARCKEDKEKKSYSFCSLYALQFILCVLMLIIYLFSVFLFSNQYTDILLIQTIFLVSVAFDINWFFFGIEKFKLTISRNVIIKLLSLILIFIFVRHGDDLWKYIVIMGGSTLLSQLYLWIYINKYVYFVRVRFKDIIGHLKKCLILFVPVIAYSIYRVMDKTMIGTMIGTMELGFYENAEKIINIPVSFITALGTVMLPYMSKNYQDDKNVFNRKLYNSFNLCFCFIIPMMFGLIAIGETFSNVFFGAKFYKSGKLIQILSVGILFTSIANVIRTNYLIPKEKDNIYVISTILGAIFNLIFNLILIPKYGAYGAAIGTLVAEFTVMIYQIIKIKKEIPLISFAKLLISYLLKGMIMLIIICQLPLLIKNNIILLFAQIIIAIVVYFILDFNYIIYDFLGIKNK